MIAVCEWFQLLGTGPAPGQTGERPGQLPFACSASSIQVDRRFDAIADMTCTQFHGIHDHSRGISSSKEAVGIENVKPGG